MRDDRARNLFDDIKSSDIFFLFSLYVELFTIFFLSFFYSFFVKGLPL